MVHVHADGSEEMRPRTPAEIAALENEMRIAARANWRTGDRRKRAGGAIDHRSNGPWDKARGSGTDQRQILSTFEREMLLGAIHENA